MQIELIVKEKRVGEDSHGSDKFNEVIGVLDITAMTCGEGAKEMVYVF